MSSQDKSSIHGKVEVLLTPGVFLRLGENSEARIVSSGLANVEVALARGQAAVEADYWSKDNRLRIDYGHGFVSRGFAARSGHFAAGRHR